MKPEDKVFRVWVGILVLTDEIWKYVAITKAYKRITAENSCASKSADFLDVAFQAIWDQLLLDISKIFDRARTCGNENCSIDLLKELIQESVSFSEAEKEIINQEADRLCENFDKIISRDMRNKQIAHYDLESLLNNAEKEIPSEELEAFVVSVAGFLSNISTRFLNERGSIRFYSLEGTIKKYEDDMRKIYESNKKLHDGF
ncbi:hypothetical protein KFE19_16140 [Dysosmobacter sp. Marseille-Q4140]|nr:hypothetical protein KFE19_16140 [Dysosmobacter sp. Marseille-Q4140]